MQEEQDLETNCYSGIEAVLEGVRETNLRDSVSVHSAINSLLWIGEEASNFQASCFYRGCGWENGDLDPILELYGRKIQRFKDVAGNHSDEAERVFSSCMVLASCLDGIVKTICF